MRIYFELLVIHLRRKIFMLLPNRLRIRMLRQDGVKVGEDCLVHTPYFSTEPYLIEIGNHVAISAGTEFITHDAVGWMFPDHPNMGLFGTIKVGDNTFFGLKCLILPGTSIGRNCVIGAGSVVRGAIPDDSVVMGNPARVVMKTSLLKQLLVHSRNRLETHLFSSPEKRRALCQHFGIE
ncbi:MAG TPA: acyltransferase [Candidatus Sulfotelmatobacter sp.]|nr:acyltransferase [Candidatus Sulfotelmatobacter sp.]